jgi:hypothetical protein
MSQRVMKKGMGWIPDYFDFRDFTEKIEEIKSVLGPKGGLKINMGKLRPSVPC